jgi:hypothetical protein
MKDIEELVDEFVNESIIKQFKLLVHGVMG